MWLMEVVVVVGEILGGESLRLGSGHLRQTGSRGTRLRRYIRHAIEMANGRRSPIVILSI